MSLDRIPGDLDLYIGGLFTLRRSEALRKANITHVVSVLRLPFDHRPLEGCKHHVIEVDDIEDDNILEHFPRCNEFIQEGLDGGGGVLVHCAMGKSRSATVIIAYLLAINSSLTPSTALALIRQSRPFAEPNSGFMRQLELYHTMHCPSELDGEPEYQRWLYQRTVEVSNAAGVAPDTNEILFGDERPVKTTNENGATNTSQNSIESTPVSSQTQRATTYRCRRCRFPLGNSSYLTPHTPKAPQKGRPPHQECAHLFLEPLSWMRQELEQGKLEGRLECPNAKCRTQVGRYAWQGMKCSCEAWVVPAVSLGRGRIDEIIDREGGQGRGSKGRI